MALQGGFLQDAWLTSVLDMPCFAWQPVVSSQHGLEVEDFPLGLVSTKLDTRAPNVSETLSALHGFGFRLVTVEVALEGQLSGGRDLSEPTILGVRRAVPADLSVVEQIGRHGFQSDRFHRDPLIPDTTADRVKAEWVTNFFAGKRGTDLYIGEVDGAAAGFLLINGTSEELVIDLIAVRAVSRGRGVARRMISQAVHEATSRSPGGQVTVRVGTQIDNAASIRTYSAFGLTITDSRYVLHRMVTQP